MGQAPIEVEGVRRPEVLYRFLLVHLDRELRTQCILVEVLAKSKRTNRGKEKRTKKLMFR